MAVSRADFTSGRCNFAERFTGIRIDASTLPLLAARSRESIIATNEPDREDHLGTRLNRIYVPFGQGRVGVGTFWGRVVFLEARDLREGPFFEVSMGP